MTVVAIVPAKDRADSIGATVSALSGVAAVDLVVVVDDGSSDATADRATEAGATAVRLGVNRGKGAAVFAGVAAAPDAGVYLLIDADLGGTAALAAALLGPVVAGEADMTVAVLPSAGRRGGFGSIRRLAAAGIRRATGLEVRAPLSGQRAVDGGLLRSLSPAGRFGLEAGLTIDAVRAGARLVEVDVAMDHRHTGRRLSGFRHRAGQGVDVVRALWPRLTSVRWRMALVVAALVVATLGAVWSGGRAEPDSVAWVGGEPGGAGRRVVLFGMPGLRWDDVGTGRLRALDALVARGAVAATSVRTLSSRPSTSEGYATVGAGARVAAPPLEGGAAYAAATGGVVVVGAAEVQRRNDGRSLSSRPGALGDALHGAGRRTAVIGNADRGCGAVDGGEVSRPGALAVMDFEGSVDAGEVGCGLLVPAGGVATGWRADPAAVLAAFDRALGSADVIVVDPGDLDRAARPTGVGAVSVPGGEPDDIAGPVERLRERALADTDALLGEVVRRMAPDDVLMVVSVVPPAAEWRLTPMVVAGAGAPHGFLHSPSTRRAGLVTLSDVAPTVLAASGVATPEGMIGQPLRVRPGRVDLPALGRLDRDAAYRERIYLPLTVFYIAFQVALYLLAVVAYARLGGVGRRARRPLRALLLGISAYPLATFVFRAIPDVAEWGLAGIAVLVAVDAAIVAVACRARSHALSPLSWILGATIALLAVDVATGARLQASSLMGYALHTASRFTGLGNTAFAVLAGTTLLLGAVHVATAPRRREAVFSVACLFAFVVVVDGAPVLGADIGGILTLVPVFGLTLLAFAGRPLTHRTLALTGAVTVAALALATGLDLLRPEASQTHLGRFVGQIAEEGGGVFVDTVSRKLSVNLRSYRSPWTWAIVAIALGLIASLVRGRGWGRLAPPRSAARAGAVATLVAGLVGFAVNDSGPVVLALVFVYVGPFLTLLAIAGEEGRGLDAVPPPPGGWRPAPVRPGDAMGVHHAPADRAGAAVPAAGLAGP